MEKHIGDIIKAGHGLRAIPGGAGGNLGKQKQADSAVAIALDPAKIDDAMFHHSVFCQTYLPYRDPGNDVTVWEQQQGSVSLAVQTVQLKNPVTEEWERVGLPYGTRARLILAYMNTLAVKGQSQVIEVEEHFSGFIKRLGLNRNGRTINEIKEQLRRITASIITLGFQESNRYLTVNFGIVKATDLWFQKDDRQKILWASQICLSDDYFNSLLKHAIPLDERAIGALAHNAMALDIYSWLAQRLHRIPEGKKQFVSWQNLKDQFGRGFNRMDHFKSTFRENLKLVVLQYPAARHSIEEDYNAGLNLKNAAAPVTKQLITVPEPLETSR